MKPNLSASPAFAITSAADLSVLHRLRSAFSLFDDTRQQSKVLHRLDEVLVCSFCAILCDADSFTDMEDFATTQLPWLRSFLTLKHGAPSHDVFRNVFMKIDPQAMIDILSQWSGPLNGLHIAIDGKTLRGT
ncbi:MAG: ISAs1 family transposase, partial [Prosthecobacter sp.]|uniref:ISAs1 family transposase n=1 Tax=Prosthecobacter sp. TaxID=1965333 RepID=UPI0038FD99BC